MRPRGFETLLKQPTPLSPKMGSITHPNSHVI